MRVPYKSSGNCARNTRILADKGERQKSLWCVMVSVGCLGQLFGDARKKEERKKAKNPFSGRSEDLIDDMTSTT